MKIEHSLLPFFLIALLLQSCDSKRERFVVVEPLAGFANRMRAMASAHVTAEHMGAKLVIKWDKQNYHMEGVNDVYELFKPSDLFMSFADFKKNYPSYHQKYVDGDVGYYRNDTLDETNAYEVLPFIADDEHDVIRIVSSTNFKPDAMRFGLFIQRYKHFYENMQPVDEINKKVEQFYAVNMKNKRLYGVHFRDWKGEGFEDHARSANYENLFIEKIAEIHDQDPEAIFFIASNKVAIIDTFKAGVPANGRDIFLRYPLSTADRNSLQGIRDALVEWYLLGQTKAIIGTYMSSYSEEAAILTSNIKKYNIGPTGYTTNFHSIFCFNNEGNIFSRPYVDGAYDPCVKFSLTSKL